MHWFHSVLMKGAAIFNVKVGNVQVPLTFRPKILTSGDVSGDVVARELPG